MRLIVANPSGEPDVYMAHFRFAEVSEPDALYKKIVYCGIHHGVCPVKVRPCEAQQNIGIAHCSKKDNFRRWTGRKLAFTRAVAGFPRDIRAGLWTAYLQQSPAPASKK